MNVGFIGVGKLGKEAANVMVSAGHYVEGYDIVTIPHTEFVMNYNLKDLCEDKDLIFVAVPTPHHKDYDGSQPTSHLTPKDFDYSIVKEVLQEINEYTNKEQIVVLISTVLPGTIRREFYPLIKNYKFIINDFESIVNT
jgi:UDPglucose 6-dehydrogenase